MRAPIVVPKDGYKIQRAEDVKEGFLEGQRSKIHARTLYVCKCERVTEQEAIDACNQYHRRRQKGDTTNMMMIINFVS